MHAVRIGTSSFSEPDWVGNFYPPGTKPADFLRLYAEKYDTVEIDATYYAIPSARTVLGWKDRTPDAFTFCAKFPKSIVHGGDGPKPDSSVIMNPTKTDSERDRFLETIRLLGEKLDTLLIQFPYFGKDVFASADPFLGLLDAFLGCLPTDIRFAVEIRNKYWLVPTLSKILKSHNVSLALTDQSWMPHGDEVAKFCEPVTSDLAYIRLLGDRHKIESLTTTWDKPILDDSPRLTRWADLIADLYVKDTKINVFVNNHLEGHAPSTISKLTRMLDLREIAHTSVQD